MQRIILLLIVVLLFIGCSSEPQPPLPVEGEWFVKRDHQKTGIDEKWYVTTFDLESASPITLSAISASPDSVATSDWLWFFTEFSYPPRTGRVFLEFPAVNTEYKIWLNQQNLNVKIPDQTKEKYEVTPAILQGINRLTVLVKGGIVQGPFTLVFDN